METREPSEKVAEVARRVLERDDALAYIRASHVRIAYLASDVEKKAKRRPVLAECERVPAKWKWAVPYDFAVTVFTPNAERLTDEQMEILMLHELMHIGIDLDGNEESYYVVPHDVEDFKAILERFGVDWSE